MDSCSARSAALLTAAGSKPIPRQESTATTACATRSSSSTFCSPSTTSRRARTVLRATSTERLCPKRQPMRPVHVGAWLQSRTRATRTKTRRARKIPPSTPSNQAALHLGSPAHALACAWKSIQSHVAPTPVLEHLGSQLVDWSLECILLLPLVQ